MKIQAFGGEAARAGCCQVQSRLALRLQRVQRERPRRHLEGHAAHELGARVGVGVGWRCGRARRARAARAFARDRGATGARGVRGDTHARSSDDRRPEFR